MTSVRLFIKERRKYYETLKFKLLIVDRTFFTIDFLIYFNMNKQHFTTQVARLVNPPLLSQFKQVQQDYMENIYASKIAPVGQGKPLRIPPESVEKGFGILTEKGDSADILVYPSNCRMLHSIYGHEFLPPHRYPHEELLPAGVSKNCTDGSGDQMKELFNWRRNNESSNPASSSDISNENKTEETEYKSQIGFYQGDKCNCCEARNEPKTSFKSMNLQISFMNLLNISDSSYFKKFYFFLKSQLRNCPENISIAEFQAIILNFGVCVTICKLRKFLTDFHLMDICTEIINVHNLVDALDWKLSANGSLDSKKSCFSESKKRIFNTDADASTDHLKTYYATNNIKYKEPQKPAGIPTIRYDIRRPQLKIVADFTEYGDVKNGSSIIQPDVFERNGIYDDDLFAVRPKNEILSILRKSGICFQNEMFDVIWENLNKEGKASIGNVWNTLKHLYLTKIIT